MRWCLVWEAATRSRNLDTNTRLVIALKFARCSFSDEALLNLGRRRPTPLPYGQDRFKQFSTPGLDLSRGFPGGDVTGQIEPCIITQ